MSATNRDEARADLAAQCREHGAQTRLAARCGVPVPYINRILRAGGLPSRTLRVALERETGIPAKSWAVECWTRRKAADAVAAQALLEPFDGYTARRCGVEEEVFRAILASEQVDAPRQMREWARDALGVPIEAWDASAP